MPIDINLLRKEKGGNVEAVKESQKKRFASVDLVDQVIALDEEWKGLQSQWESMKMEINLLQSEIVKKLKAKEDASSMIEKKKELGGQEIALKKKVDEIKLRLDAELAKIGNIVDPSVPVSSNEDDNTIVTQWGTPRNDEGLLYHHAVLHRIDGYEPEKGVQVAGHRGYFLKGMAVLLNQAIINYSMQFLTKKRYTLLQPPYFMNKSVMSGVAQLEDFDEQLYKVIGEDEKYLIATSEQPICAYHKDEWITESSLPLKYAGYSTCFRKESGAHGKDTWGIFRVHQFDKIEQFCIAEPEKSQALQEEMLKVAEEFYQSLNLPYRVVNIVSGELNNAAAKKYDLEAWFPAYKEYRELVSCSNCTDYQSRAMEIRCGVKKMNQMGKKYVHMLNSTLCATSRTLSCIIENYQEADGVRVPEILIPFMGGVTFIPFAREEKVNLQAIKMEKAKGKKK